MRMLVRRALGPAILMVALGGVLAPNASAVPVCTNNHHTVEQGQPISLTLSCTGDGPVIGTGISTPLHGALTNITPTSVTYTSNATYCGPDRFTYSVADDSSSTTYTSYLDVTAGGSSCGGALNQPPSCNDVSVALDTGTTIPLPALCSDPDGDPITSFAFAAGGAPDHGSVGGGPGAFTYTPHAGYTGTDEIRFVASDGTDTSAVAVISILVTEPGGSGYLAPDETFEAPTATLSGGAALTTSIMSPTGGLVGVLAPADPPDAPSGYVLLGDQIEIVAPDATFDKPLNITFALDPGTPAGSVTVVRDGVAIDDSCDPAEAVAAVPDPCFVVDEFANAITIRTSHASGWGIALPTPTFLAPLNGGALNLANSGRVVPVKLTLEGAVEAVTLSRLVVRSTCNTEEGDEVESYAAAGSSNIGSAFRYDALAGHWVYNLSTKGLVVGTCYRGFVSSDGVEVGHFDIEITA